MYKQLSPITQMLIRQMSETKILLEEVKMKIDSIELEKEIKKKKPSA